MKSSFILIAFAALFCGTNVEAGALDNEAKILLTFKQKYNNSQSDLAFLIDVSGSVSDYGFASEKIFVENLLNEFSVAPYSTRVSVITFGAEVKTDINYIDINPLSLTHQKCEFKPWFEHNVKHRYGWATNMKEAFSTTSNLLQTAMNNKHRRSNVHTVSILITDGYWNRGDPRANANSLKSNYGVDVIAVGVDRYSQWQLEALATSKDLVIGVSSFSKFRELAMYIRGDAHDKSFMEVGGAINVPRAMVAIKRPSAAAVQSAEYTSASARRDIMEQAFQVTVIRFRFCRFVLACIRGTYKKWPTPDSCLPCPDHSTTDAVGSIIVNQCKCFTGYEGDPSRDIACTAVECEQLVAPDNGGFRAVCGKVYDSVCEFQCNSGFNLVGSNSRRCQSDKSWSGNAVQCQIITCADLPTQAHGVKKCTGNGNEYGNTCTFTCDVGYERKGSSTRTCQADGQWSGSQATCEARKCPALRQLRLVQLNQWIA
ncbi:hypothetical protein OS493_027369 [Desmophyllum pertusum]|uniref:Uncharacterized protein n=1 Tax=Desmophyllum pertusum TaxID=174260 RepID=A0A9W9YXJ2_9CNID|nr:hypothetical protein OS493_027369 [Desmophyllum pertusum]